MSKNNKAVQFGLEVKSFPKHKQWRVDQDYVKTLSPEEKAWLNKFNQEYYRNRFSKEGDLHNSPELKRACYSNENAANRDLYSIKDVGGAMVSEYDNDEYSLIDLVEDYDMGYAIVDEEF